MQFSADPDLAQESDRPRLIGLHVPQTEQYRIDPLPRSARREDRVSLRERSLFSAFR